MTEREYEKYKAKPDYKEPQQRGQGRDPHRRQGIAEPISASEIRRSGDQAFDHGNDDRVGGRQLSCQVVINPPT